MGNSSIFDENGKKYDAEGGVGEFYSHSPTNLFVELGDNSLPIYLCAQIKKIFYIREGDYVKQPRVLANWKASNELTYDDQFDYDVGYMNAGTFIKDTILKKSTILDKNEIKKKCEQKILSVWPEFKNVTI